RQVVSVYYATNVLPGAQAITLSFAGSGGKNVAAVASEFYNVALAGALDTASSGAGTGTSVSAGTLAATSDYDLIFQYATQDGDGSNTKWTQGASPWALLVADYFDPQAAQNQVQAVHGSASPTLTQNSSKGFNTVAIALKSATAGTAPTGMRVVHAEHNHV